MLNFTYPYVVLWGKMMGSSQSYIDQQVALAQQEDAPKSAVYKGSKYESGEGVETWRTLDDVENPDAFMQMGLPIPDRLKFYMKITIAKYFADQNERDYLVNRIDEFLDSLGLVAANRGLDNRHDYFAVSQNITNPSLTN